MKSIRSFSRIYKWFWLLVLLAGCRSERVAFQFAPAQRKLLHSASVNHTQRARVETIHLDVSSINSKRDSSNLSQPADTTKPHFPGKNSAWKFPGISHLVGSPEHFLQPRAFKAARHSAVASAQQPTLPAAKTEAQSRRAGLTGGDVLKGMGIVLAIGGIVLGVQIGGWLGLVVALLLLLLGCFIGLFGALKNDELP